MNIQQSLALDEENIEEFRTSDRKRDMIT